MNAIIFSDLHGCQSALKRIEVLVNDEKNNIAVIIFAGDLVNMGEPVEYASDFIGVVNRASKPLLWVPGNNDFGFAYDKLIQFRPSLEGRVVEIAGRRFTGVGGAPASWAGSYAGEKSLSAEKIAGSIFVSHYPPPPPPGAGNPKYQILNSKQIKNTENSNDKKVLNFKHSDLDIISDLGFRYSDLPFEKRLVDVPLAHICGHIHQERGLAYLGSTKIIKLASAEIGHYAIMNLENLEVEFKQFP